jgi:hypothetical protein
VRSAPKTPEESGFLAGAALVALHPMACHDHPIRGLWRQRLALANAAALACHAGRTEGGAPTGHRRRDAWYLRLGDDPGPAGRLFQAWRRLAERGLLDKAIRLVLRPKDWMVDLTNALDETLDDALEDVGDVAKTLAAGEGSAIAAAAWRRQLAKTSRRRSARPVARRRRARHRLRWPRRSSPAGFGAAT